MVAEVYNIDKYKSYRRFRRFQEGIEMWKESLPEESVRSGVHYEVIHGELFPVIIPDSDSLERIAIEFKKFSKLGDE